MLVEQVREVFYTVLELSMELRSVLAFIIVGDNDCPLVLLWLSFLFDRVRQKVHCLCDLQGFFPLRLGNLCSLVVLGEDGLLSNFTELLVEMNTLLIIWLAVSCIVYRVNWCDQLRRSAEFVLNKLLFSLLHTHASHIFSETPHRGAFVRAEDSSVIIGRINSLDFYGFAAEILKLERKLFFNGFGVFILLSNSLGKSFIGILGGALGRVEPGNETGYCTEENRTICTLGGASGCSLVSTADASSWGPCAYARFIECCVGV